MSKQALKFWLWLHKWTSLASILVLLVMFISGIPLLFRVEIEAAVGYGKTETIGSQQLPLDTLMKAGMEKFPGEVVQFFVWEDDKPGAILLSMATSADARAHNNRNILIRQDTAELMNEKEGPLSFFLDLHTDLMMGPTGRAFTGLMALALILATLSGIVIYAPFVSGNLFGSVRRNGSRRLKWLDLHNLLGSVIFLWVLVVGFTGMINSWGEYLVQYWRYDQLAEMTVDYQGQSLPETMVPVQEALVSAEARLPDMIPWFIAMPQSFMSTSYHYTVYMRGATPRTERLVQPVLVDAASGSVTGSRAMPFYMQVLMLSQPLHFGDYGGLPLKIIWALLSALTVVVLMSGLYLWWVRRSKQWPELLQNEGVSL